MSQEKETPSESEKPKRRDGWDKAQITGQLLLPIVVASVGVLFTYCQNERAQERQKADKEIELERQKTDKVTNLLKHLASKEEKENLLAIQVIEYLGKTEQGSPELIAALIGVIKGGNTSEKVISAAADKLVSVANESKDPKVRQEVKESFEKAVSTEQNSQAALNFAKSLAKVDEQAATNLPARVYLHILRGASREQAENLEKQLEANGLNVPGIDSVDAVPNQNELRYFYGSNQDDLIKITRIMSGLGIKTNTVDLSRRYPNTKIRPRHYEIWFGKQ